MTDQASKPSFLPDLDRKWRVLHDISPLYDHFSVHHHSGYEFLLHIRGGGSYHLDQEVITLQPYQLIVVRPHQLHGLLGSHPLRDYERMVVHVSEETMATLRLAGSSVKELLDRCCEAGSCQAILTPQDYLRLKTIAGLIPPAESSASQLEQMEALGALSVLLSRLCQALTAAPPDGRPRIRDVLTENVYNHILEHFGEDCSLNALADRFSISKYHLSRRFSSAHGISLHQFVLHCRMAYAQVLIRKGEPMVSIAHQCGFNDYSTFVRAFTRFTGDSPRAWRKRLASQRAQT